MPPDTEAAPPYPESQVTPPVVPAVGGLRAMWTALRPHQWVKNLFFVGAPLLFSKSLLQGDQLLRATAAVALFSLLSSSVYLWNDLVDRDKDRQHPLKRLRPIASGTLGPGMARLLAASLATTALTLGFLLDERFAAVAAAYLALNLGYSLILKKLPYLDVISIALGFLLRVYAGALAIHVQASPFLFLCTGLLACFLGFGKRAHELATAGDQGAAQRAVLALYRPRHLRIALWTTGLVTIAAYFCYTVAEHTRIFFHTNNMVWTLPCIAFGVGRFLILVAGRPKAESPTEALLRDPPFMLNLAVWVAAVVGIIYQAR